jgi:putative transposase
LEYRQSQRDWNLSARRCEERATLGNHPNEFINPVRIESLLRLPHHYPMSQSLSKILVHAVFSTKDRRPFLRDKSLRDELHHYIGGILNNLDCQSLIVGGVEDHIHFLCALSRTCTAAEVIKETKRGSSLWIKTESKDLHDFSWQEGYGIFSIGFSQIEPVKEYIAGQDDHHLKVTFQDEFRQLLKRYEIEFDERYVWT